MVATTLLLLRDELLHILYPHDYSHLGIAWYTVGIPVYWSMMKHILLIKKNEAGQLKEKLKKQCEKEITQQAGWRTSKFHEFKLPGKEKPIASYVAIYLAKNFSYDSQHVTLNNPIKPSSGKAINKLTSKWK